VGRFSRMVGLMFWISAMLGYDICFEARALLTEYVVRSVIDSLHATTL